MKKIIFLTISILIMSCSNDHTSEQNEFVITSDVNFNILSQNGADLLNSATTDYFSTDNMQLYYLIGGEKIKVQDFDPQIGGKNGIMLGTETTPYFLRCFTYSHGDEGLIKEENGIKTGIAIAYLELNGEVTDTIKTEWESKEGKYFRNTKVWYNDVLVLPQYAENVFSIIK
ncbi:MAG: hypothetical protein ACOH1N_01635 [Lutibacter sp.]